MARVVLVCHRNSRIRDRFHEEAKRLNTLLSPENIPVTSPIVRTQDGVHLAVLNPIEALPIKGASVALGCLFPLPDHWDRPGAGTPEGVAALFRADSQWIDIHTDIINSRTIWYYMDQDIFVASTSQRAVVYFLESFEPYEETYAWMLSSGTLGPGLSWDRRIRSMPTDCQLTLDRTKWQYSFDKNEPQFNTRKLGKRIHARMLNREIERTLKRIRLDESRWVVPLSGGYDSRLLLLMLHETHPDLQCVTWGEKNAHGSKYNDAAIARRLCEELNVHHEYFEVNVSPEPVEDVFRRFVVHGEGRIDHISAYLDGFDLWRRLFLKGVRGIVRGDECFGSRYLYSELDFRKFLLATMLSDYEEFQEMKLPSGLAQNWPAHFRPGQQETLETWRDRMYAEYYCSYCLGALNELKLGYMEIINPLAARNIIEQVRTLPDRWRNEKALLRHIVRQRSPAVPFAKYAAIDLGRNFLKHREVKTLLLDELRSTHCRSLLPPTLLNKTEEKITANHAGGIGAKYLFIRQIRPFISPRIVKKVQKIVSLKERVDYFDVALRCYIISTATRMLSQDACALNDNVYLVPPDSENGVGQSIKDTL